MAHREIRDQGHEALLEGRIYTRKWQDKDGTDRYTTEITADHHHHAQLEERR
ncbi:single-stranded DNA-binding protein (plasmid) [Rhizobium leguminosarum]